MHLYKRVQRTAPNSFGYDLQSMLGMPGNATDIRQCCWFKISGHWAAFIVEPGETFEHAIKKYCDNETNLIISKPEGLSPGEWADLHKYGDIVFYPEMTRPVPPRVSRTETHICESAS